MGSTKGDTDEQPVHKVALDAFWIDRTEVTAAQFAAFLNEMGNGSEGEVTWLNIESEECPIEQAGDDFRPKEGYADRPAVELSWHGAEAYCEWAGGALPTEAQWEYAARGPKASTYPWGGSAPDCDTANFLGPDGECLGRPAPVGSLPGGASWCGALDMAGNVWEWTAGWYGDYPAAPQTNPTGPPTGEGHAIRGGGWGDPADLVRAAYRAEYEPQFRSDDLGFRCMAVPGG
jgi:formylglycine-generating enzyme required for sulfatase activity